VKKTFLLSSIGLAIAALAVVPGVASSHREAPLISTDPLADNTDLYAFRSPDRPDTVTIITYQFRFHTETRNPDTFLYNTGPITSLDDPNWNRRQTYTLRVRHGSSLEVLGRDLTTPPDNIGPRSTPNYSSLAAAAVHTLPGGIKVFAGQRDDPFFVDLGSVFDLAGLRPFNPVHLIPLPAAPGRDAVARYNTHSIAIQVPIAQLVKASHPTIGIYASASRRAIRVFQSDGSIENFGQFVQVSRLGEPLINEAVIPLGRKDEWNRSDPENDASFEGFYTRPEVSRLENLLYGSALSPIDVTNRADLVAILLTGVPGLNFTGARKADLLRLNTSIAPSASPSRLAVLDGDLAGFPNGRRLTDDVVDIELRAFAQGYGQFLHGLLGLPNKAPNNLLGDGVDANDLPFLAAFPYVAKPHEGYKVP
jgi:hypothetical protein